MNVTFFVGKIAIKSNRVQDHLADIELLAKETSMYKLSKRSMNLDLMGRGVKGVDEKGS